MMQACAAAMTEQLERLATLQPRLQFANAAFLRVSASAKQAARGADEPEAARLAALKLRCIATPLAACLAATPAEQRAAPLLDALLAGQMSGGLLADTLGPFHARAAFFLHTLCLERQSEHAFSHSGCD